MDRSLARLRPQNGAMTNSSFMTDTLQVIYLPYLILLFYELHLLFFFAYVYLFQFQILSERKVKLHIFYLRRHESAILIYESLFVQLEKIVNELLYCCEMNDQKHGFCFSEIVLVFNETRFEFQSTKIMIKNQI